MVKPESAMALFVEKPRKVIQKGITRPPPPMPQTVEIELMMISRVNPMNSIPMIGNTFLCWHTPDVAWVPP